MARDLLIPAELYASAAFYWSDRGREWTDALPRTIADVCSRWSLTLTRPLYGSSTAYVAEVCQATHRSAIMKITFPDVIGEADALIAYDGHGAITLLNHDAARCALLLEQCRPGSTLAQLDDDEEMLATASSLMKRLWSTTAPPSIPTLYAQCLRFAEEGELILADAIDIDFDLASEGLSLLRHLCEDQHTEVLLHGDFHPRNILRATREPWLASDPRPLRGDPAYEPIPLIIETPTADHRPLDETELIRRVGSLAVLLSLSPRQIALWGIARRTDWALFCYQQDRLTEARQSLSEARWFRNAADRYMLD